MQRIMQIPAIVINLKRSNERRRLIEKQCSEKGITYELIEAVDGYTADSTIFQDFNEIRKTAYAGSGREPRKCTPGVTGCALSHAAAYKYILSNGYESALILEDDASITEDLRKVLESKDIKEILKSKADIIQLAVVKPGYIYQIELTPWGRRKLDTGMIIGKPSKPIPGASCYLISRNGAQKLLDSIKPLRFSADQLLMNCKYFDVNLMALKHPISTQNRTLASTIENSGEHLLQAYMDKQQQPWLLSKLKKASKNLRRKYSFLSILKKFSLYSQFEKEFLIIQKYSEKQRAIE